MTLATGHHLLPPFAEGVKTAPLVSISLAKLEAHDAAESQAFYNASKDLGFFYLNMKGSEIGEKIVSCAEQLHQVAHDFFGLPSREKDDFAREKLDPFFGYRLFRERINEAGKTERDENYNARCFLSDLLSCS